MLTLFKTILIAYLVVWGILLICCIRRKKFSPLLGGWRRTRLLWLLTFLFLNPLLTLLYLVFGQLRSPHSRPSKLALPLVFLAVIIGFFVNIPGLTHLWMQPFVGRSAGSDEYFKAHLASINSSNNTSTTSSITSSDHSRLACGRIAVVVQGEHLLLKRIGAALRDELTKVPHVETVELYPDGQFPANDRRAPDIFIRLTLDFRKEDLFPYSLELQAVVRAFVGREPWRSRSSYVDNRTPPVLDFDMRIEIDHTSKTTGYESQRYTLAAKNIAGQLSDTLSKNLKKWEDKYGLLPEIPTDFYGDYEPAELPEPLKKLHPQVVCSYTGLLKHNETFHRLVISPDRIEAFEKSVDQMKDTGWDIRAREFDDDFINIRLKNNNRRIQIFTPREDRRRARKMQASDAESTDTNITLYVRDVHLLSDAELCSTIDKLFSEPSQLELLMLFERMFNQAQRDKIFDLLEQNRPSDVRAQLYLAETYEAKGQVEESKQALQRVPALLWSIHDDTNFKTRLKNLAKKLGDKELADKPPTEEAFREAGFIEVAKTAMPIERQVGLDSPVVLFYRDSNDKLRTLSLTILRSGNENDPFVLRHVERTANSRSLGSRGGWRHADNIWMYAESHDLADSTLRCEITSLEGGDNFKMSLNIIQ